MKSLVVSLPVHLEGCFFFLLGKFATLCSEMCVSSCSSTPTQKHQFQFRSLTVFSAVQFKDLLGICMGFPFKFSSQWAEGCFSSLRVLRFCWQGELVGEFSSFPELCCHLSIKHEASPNETLLGQRLATFSLLFPERTVESEDHLGWKKTSKIIEPNSEHNTTGLTTKPLNLFYYLLLGRGDQHLSHYKLISGSCRETKGHPKPSFLQGK